VKEEIQMSQLKKSDFLNAVSETPMTREELVDALTDFEFIASYLDYLTDHFVSQGKVIRNDDGTIQCKPKGSTSARVLFKASEAAEAEVDGVIVTSVQIKSKEMGPTDHYTDSVKAEGWRLTPNAAAKALRQAIFAEYKARTAAVNAAAESYMPEGEEVAEEAPKKKRASRKKK